MTFILKRRQKLICTSNNCLKCEPFKNTNHLSVVYILHFTHTYTQCWIKMYLNGIILRSAPERDCCLDY